ncbi:MAG TPA: gas vesicle protein GvpJ [Gemmatimonadaceae bacterium]|nr:gas vesicle protein GvpJ [Gemmatimonadaceae bacterium]
MADLVHTGGDSDAVIEEEEPLILSDLINRVLDKGVVIGGEVTIAVAGVDLVRVDLRLLLVAVERLVRGSIEPPA